MDFFFEPRGVAVIGATPNPLKGGNAILKNLLLGYRGGIYPVNPRYHEIENELCDLLNVLFLADHDENIAVLDDEVGPGHHRNLAGNNVPHCDDIDVIPAPELELGEGLAEGMRWAGPPPRSCNRPKGADSRGRSET